MLHVHQLYKDWISRSCSIRHLPTFRYHDTLYCQSLIARSYDHGHWRRPVYRGQDSWRSVDMPFLLRQQTDDEVVSENTPERPAESTTPTASSSTAAELSDLGEFNVYLPPSRPMLSSTSEGVHLLLMWHASADCCQKFLLTSSPLLRMN